MPRRPWDAKTTAMIGVEGLQGTPVADIGPEPQISQAPDAQWRDQFLAHAAKAVEVHAPSQREARLAREHARLTTLVGALTWECTKRDERLGCAGRRPHREPGATTTGLSTSERARLLLRCGAIGASGHTCALSSSSP